MRTSLAWRRLGRAVPGWSLAVLSLLACLTGCESNPPVADGSHVSSVATPSDDNEVRKRARIRLELASSYFDEGKTTVALDEVKQVLNIDPTFADAYNLRGLIFMRLEDLNQAEDGFKRALALSPRDPNVLHNYGWLMCQQRRYSEADKMFTLALSSPLYSDKAKTYMAQGVCQARAGDKAEAEHSLLRSYELNAGNPITGYNLAMLLYQRGDYKRAQFYIRRLNNGEYANAESLWLGIRVEHRMNDQVALGQLVEQLKKRFPQSRELASFERGAFDE